MMDGEEVPNLKTIHAFYTYDSYQNITDSFIKPSRASAGYYAKGIARMEYSSDVVTGWEAEDAWVFAVGDKSKTPYECTKIAISRKTGKRIPLSPGIRGSVSLSRDKIQFDV